MAPRLTESSIELIDSHEGRLSRVETTVHELAVDVKELSTKHDYTQKIIEDGFSDLKKTKEKKIEWRMGLISGIIVALVAAGLSLGVERLFLHH